MVVYETLNYRSEFEIESNTGVIRTKRVLERATGDIEFLLYVTAHDEDGKTSDAIVKIQVISSPDSIAKFWKQSYEVSLREGQGLVSNLLCIAASGSKGNVKYSMKSGGDSRFQIDPVTGKFKTQNAIAIIFNKPPCIRYEF